MAFSLIKGCYLNALIDNGVVSYVTPSGKQKSLMLLYWGLDHLFVFRSKTDFWFLYLVNKVDPESYYPAEKL